MDITIKKIDNFDLSLTKNINEMRNVASPMFSLDVIARKKNKRDSFFFFVSKK